MGSDVFHELRESGVTPRELEVLRLVGDRLQNQEIAARLRLSERTVESHVSSLLRKLGGSNRLALVETAARLRAGRGPRRVLPRPLSSFVGRARETGDVRRLLDAHRMVTLTGPAGTGKTRLALYLAHAVTALPPAVLVDLAPLSPGDAVERVFADALGVVGEEHRLRALIRGTLAEGRHWLVVDNCEHVTAPVAELLAELLAATDHLHVLATGHEALHLAGEAVYEIPPLPLPAEPGDPAAVLDSGAGRLFAERAATASPGFEITAGNARQVAAICRRLDGLPLAIELAAARIRFFTPAELLARLDDRFALLTDGARGAPNRHRTLEEALTWSYELLSEDERLLLERCSVFPGAFDYDTAAQVLAHPPLDPAGLIRVFSRLLDRSLVSSRHREETTEYRLLDSVRQFAHRRLLARGAAGTAHEEHARHHLRRAVAAVPDLRGRDQAAALRWIDQRSADLRAALRWVLDRGDTAAAWEFIAGIGTAWEVVGCSGEIFDWLGRLLQRPLPDGDLGFRAAITCAVVLCYQDAERAREHAEHAHRMAAGGTDHDRALALLALGWTMRYGERRAESPGHLARATALFERLGDDWHRAMALSGYVFVADVDATLTRLAHAAELFGGLGDHVGRANCLNEMAIRAIERQIRLDDVPGWLAESARLARISGNDHERLHAELYRATFDQHRGEHVVAQARFAGLLAEFRRIGDLRCAVRCLLGLGRAAGFDGDDEHARRYFAEGARAAVGLGDVRITALGLRLLAGADHATGRFERAAALLGTAERLDPAAREVLLPDPGLPASLRERLGPEGFDSAFAEGYRTPPAGQLEGLASPLGTGSVQGG
ncbi:ATP-binding protein [Planomonospora venezuelensis]|uniref:Putative ATPase/DNA-binding CsgD family transcriptional regulator n=1 Tax=Planomonospora venezuelensis TaxID=1999 RepID=A0A841D534_PLAVE|nr:LuxR C-terminal-related transcriptional regulator [Planomonospora venezuelensis]MBB5963468.1 putative ATPase/DNA-binding CsgD family transcriptional regulator [Planomonospora venezuelensis]